MSFWNSRHVKKTQKTHKCAYCGSKIPVGSSCFHETGTYDGDFNDYRLCERCGRLINNYRNEFCSENEIGEFTEDLVNTDILDCPNCHKARFSEYDFSEDSLSIEIECDNCDHTYTVDLSFEAIDEFLRSKGDAQQ